MSARPCSVVECQDSAHARGLCSSHYMKLRRYGNPTEPDHPRGTGRGPVPLAERLTNRWTVHPETGCWIWTAKGSSAGYGEVYVDGKRCLVHRAIYELMVGPIPDGHVVRHHCDTPACVNPDHLAVGSQADNLRDMRERGRAGGQYKALPREHGTWRGYHQHRNRREPICDECRLAGMRERRRIGLVPRRREIAS